MLNKKNSNSKIISNNRNKIMFCDKCGCILYKNGKTKNGIQKYICSGCKKTSSETTGTITYHSKLSFDVWKNIIDNLIDGFSIRRIAEENSAQSDEKYFKINMKGTKPVNMPRYSKKRTSKGGTIRGISHHQICVISVIDENNNLFFKIGGLERGTTEMLESSISSHLETVKTIIADNASAYQEFCKNHKINLIAIPSHFHNDEIHNIAEINNVH